MAQTRAGRPPSPRFTKKRSVGAALKDRTKKKKNKIVSPAVHYKTEKKKSPLFLVLTVEAVVRGEKFLCRRRSHDDDE